jgi:hypothetical protein
MPDPDKPLEPEHVACEVCLKEVPKSEATSPEATDYVIHFCGIDCYERWRRAEGEPDPGGKPPGT